MLIGLLDFKGPNSLEAALHKNFAPIFLKRNGLCYEKAMYVNVVCNVVNTEHKNRNTGTHSIESLLQKWNEGLCIQYELFKGKSCTEVEKASFTFTKRN